MSRLAIRFDGPPSHEGGRFVDVELDGRSVEFGKWEKDGAYWLLVMPPEVAAAKQMLEALKAIVAAPYGIAVGDLERARAAIVAVEGERCKAHGPNGEWGCTLAADHEGEHDPI